MKSRLLLFGHPVHAMVVGFPIGLYTTALACDALYLIQEDAFWFKMAYWAIIFGLVTHLGAVVTGLPDFIAVMRERTPARRPATSHLVFGVGLLVIQVLNVAVRHGGNVPIGGSVAMPLIVNLIAVTLTSVQGWYGGELVYRHLVGVEIPDPTQQGKHKDKKHH
ncbi:MAG: DUF2231 domain-containing protein [Nitrospiraceae bacterium]